MSAIRFVRPYAIRLFLLFAATLCLTTVYGSMPELQNRIDAIPRVAALLEQGEAAERGLGIGAKPNRSRS